MKLDDRYQILDKIGAGSYATVYRARDNELGREVAIKQIHEQYLADPKLLERYWNEAQLLASLQHPNIVTIFDLVRDRGWLVMELMQASLSDRLQGRQMDLRSLKTALAHCLRALKYLHTRGVIHGDIKPSNLMIDHRKRVKLGDFGLARRVSDEDGSLLKGTAKYIAPEVVSDEFGEVGPHSDLYSLGFSAYELMCGSEHFEQLFPGLSAFARDKQAAWIMWHAALDRRLPEVQRVLEGVPPDLARVIQKLTEKDPAKRYASADEALSDLQIDLKLIKSEQDAETEVEALPDPDRNRKRVLMGMFAASMLLSLLMLFMPGGEPSGPTQAINTVGVVRSVNGETRSLVYEDPVEGLPQELALTRDSRIKLLRPGESDQYILPQDIEPGSWIEIERTRKADSDASVINLIVSRPIVSQGLVRRIDTTKDRVTVGILTGKVRSDIDLFLPKRANIELNGRGTILSQLRIDDRVDVTHLIDPAGKQGHIAAKLSAWRREELVAHLASLDLSAGKLSAYMGRSDGPVREFSFDDDTRLALSDGATLKFGDLQPGDLLHLTADTYIYNAVVTRDQQLAVGAVLAVNEANRLLVIRTDSGGHIVNLQVPESCRIMLGGEQSPLSELRPEVDKVSVHYSNDENGTGTASSIVVTRAVRHDRWAMVISTGGYTDRDLTPLRYATQDGQLLRETLISHYACDPAWALHFADQNMAKVRDSLTADLPGVGRTTQVIVALFGHAYVGPDDRVYLALKDFRLNEIAQTGLPLDDLIALMESCPATEKLLLLDLVHSGTGEDLKRQPPLPEMLSKLKSQPRTVRVIGASAANERGQVLPDENQGAFGHLLSAAFRGAADKDRNLKITASELFEYLQSEMQNLKLPNGTSQTPIELP